MDNAPTPGACRIVLFAPAIFVAHVAEEAPGFVAWANSLLEDDITQQLFIAVNAVGFVVTAALAGVAALSCSREAIVLMLAWLSFLTFGNAILHVGATVALGRYSPGAVTSVVLYLPFFFLFLRHARRQFGIGLVSAAVVVVAGAFPMLLHGYLCRVSGAWLVGGNESLELLEPVLHED